MAYVLKYELLCKSRLDNNYKLKLLFDGFSGDDVDRNMPKEGALLLKKDRAAVIRGTSLEFSIREEVDFELDEFYTNNSKKIKAELYKDTTLLWTGYVLPRQYQAPYVPAPQSIKFTATDGLGLLKNEKFTLTGLNSQLAIIKHCIDKIGLGLGYSIAINLWESAHNTAYPPIAQTYEEAEIYSEYDCYTVIEKILQKYDAEISQHGGRWHITSYADKKSARKLYTSAGAYEGTESAPVVLDLGYPGTGIEVWPVGSLNRTLEPGGKKATILHDFGRKDSMLTLRNYDFAEFAAGAFTGWTQSGSFTLGQRYLHGKPYAYLDGGSTYNTDRIYREIEIDDSTDDFIFQVDYAPIGKNTSVGVQSIIMTVRFQVTLVVGATTYYLTEAGEWTTTATTISIQARTSVASPVWHKLKIAAEEVPGAGTLRISLFRYNNTETPETGDVFTGIAFSNPYAYFTVNGQLYASGLETLAVFDNSVEPDDLGKVEILASDAPDVFNKSIIYYKITRLSDGTPTLSWDRASESNGYTLIVQLARMLASRSRIARQVLTGSLRSSGTLNFASVIKHTYNSNREFEIAEGTWDMYEELWSVTLMELLAWSNESITFTSAVKNKATENQTSDGPVGGSVSGNDVSNSPLDKYLEVVNPGTAEAYLRGLLPLSLDYGMRVYSDNGQFPPSIWDAMPVASATVKGGIKVGSGLAITDGVLSASGGGGMVYPESGIALSTGTAWGASLGIDNNTNNYLVTMTGSGFNGEANLTFDGSTLLITGDVKATNRIICGGLSTLHATAIFQGKIDTTLSYQTLLTFKDEAGTIGFSVINGVAAGGFFPVFTGKVTSNLPGLYFNGNCVNGPGSGNAIVAFDGRVNNAAAAATDIIVGFATGYGNYKVTIMGNGDLTTTGIFTATGGNSGNWNTAYSWGNHAGVYDPAGTAAAAVSSHTSTYNHSNYDTAYGWGNHASAGYAASSQTFYLGTTQIAINRGSGAISLTGITSIDGTAASTPKLATANFTIEESGGYLIIKYGATVIAKISTAGGLLTKAGIGTYQAI